MIVAQAAPHLEAWPLPLSKQIQIGCPNNKDSKTLQHLIKSLEKDTSVKSSLSAQCCGHGTFVPQSNRCCDRSVSASRNLSPIFDSLLTCVLLQLGEGGCTTPPSFVNTAIHNHYSHSQRGGSTTPPPAAFTEGGRVHHPPPAAENRAGWVHHPPPAADKQGGVGPPPLPRSFQRSEGKAPPPPTPHLAANLFLGFGVTRSRSSISSSSSSFFFLFLCLVSSVLYCA